MCARCWANGHDQQSDLPTLNATLNGTSAVFLALGYDFIRQKRVAAHRACMMVATIVSIFLVSYVTYHHTREQAFSGEGLARLGLFHDSVYTHDTGDGRGPIFGTRDVIRALRERFDQHRRIARWTLPIWFYVSVTGVIIYFMLYHWYAPA